ncbi:hypothetical protein CH373_13435 [Leptospira perolatii]|uniref:Lipoprotein n=1 Tax=Leptospira perolatii TaxID=2023191 RepID=A0A2M9ZKV1_9LEPT|nr:hypothetical protein [Leptospira perolatii]PJZ69892.1 hypothetical protein CH360_08250 [Leptospira perolatii]PJZ72700.1 hypothetical protein CH373_13435 [Leptospira perolatii]
MKSERYHRILLLLLSVQVSSNCYENTPTVNKTLEIPELGFVMNYDGWTYSTGLQIQFAEEKVSKKTKRPQKVKVEPKILFYLFDEEQEKSGAPGFRTNISLISEQLPEKYSKATLDDYVASMGALYSNLYKKFSISAEPQKLEIAGQKGALVESNFLTELPEGLTEIHNYQLIFLKEGQAYVFTGSTTEIESDEKGSKILASFKGITGMRSPTDSK